MVSKSFHYSISCWPDNGAFAGFHSFFRTFAVGFASVLLVFFGIFPANAFQTGKQLGPTPGLTEDQIQDGWISLFDGSSLFGWKPVTPADWKVANGEIQVSAGERGLLRTTSQFDDFELTLEFKSEERTNSGVFLRTSPSPTDVINDCYELNIASPLDHEYPTGSLVGRAKSELGLESNKWNHFRILADGAKVKIWLNDEKAVEYVDLKPLGRGYIGLQFNSGPVAFRNISIKPLNTTALFDGKTLDGWNTDQKLESEFKVTADAELQILNGRGQIESTAQFADFVLSLKAKTNADGLNGGVFFRCIPGEVMNGYESQIQNQYKDNDRAQPVDCGTGGIFRRSNARRVNANDNAWFSKTIIATGPHVSVWVNGYLVTDWTDPRKPDPNPRRGRRVEKGTFIFQGHDPTTDILIKEIQAKEITARRPWK